MDDPFELADPGPPAVAAAREPYLDALNPPQRLAVETTEGPLLVLAGAGTGKTRVLTARLAHLLATGRAWPSQILAVTFTNKAAREMRERVVAIVGPRAEGLWLGTFHSVAARILRRHAELAGLKPNFTILGEDDQLRLVKQEAEALGIDLKRWPARLALWGIERWKDRGLGPDQVTAGEAGELAGGKLVELYAAYQARLRSVNAADFGDLLLHNLTIFRAQAEVLADYQRRFKYILVDEYQDSNVAQYLWLRLLAQGRRNLCVVGDDDQSIYGWRGAEIGNILRFEQDFPGAAVVRLEENYRSTPAILAAASGLIAHNAGRLGKTLWTRGEPGEKIRVQGCWDAEDEARFVGDEIEALQAKGEKLSSIAILVRAGFQTRAFEERFVALGLPYVVVGGTRFFDRAEIRDANAYLRTIVQPDDDLAFERIVNTPKRGLGEAALQIVHRLARAERISLWRAAAKLIDSDDLKPRPRKALAELIAAFARWRDLVDQLSPPALAERVLDESGLVAMWQADKSPDAPGRIENLRELPRGMEGFETLASYLDHVSLVMDLEAAGNADRVSLITLHGAKGLEFDTVFLPGWEEGVFPSQRSVADQGQSGLEEERRLAYVGLTRAKRRVFVSHAQSRRLFDRYTDGLPSRFIEEIPAAEIERILPQGLGGGEGLEGPLGFAEPLHASRFAPVRGRGPSLDARAERVPERASPGGFRVGQRIRHPSLGAGQIVTVEGDKLGILFDKGGVKKVMGAFVERA
ncbi:MAG: DNA helicase II [Alphaproteobacteria bacterium]|nr:DNA helicase II [Alphaproteobacteria bacterium]